MVSYLFLRFIHFFCVILLSSFLSVYSMQNQPAQNQLAQDSFFDQVKSALKNPGKALSDHIEFVHLVRALFHIPYILTVDSSNATQIKTSAALAASSVSFKLSYELFRKRDDYRLIYSLYNEPKLFSYLIAVMYDAMRFLGAAEIALKNKEEHRTMRGFKMSQIIQLAVEVCLRGFAYASTRNADLMANNQSHTETLGLCASEIADLVELWRLLSRFSTYMNLSKVEANFNVSVKKEEGKDFDGALRVGGSINPEEGIGFVLDREELDQQKEIHQSDIVELLESAEQQQADDAQEEPVITPVASLS